MKPDACQAARRPRRTGRSDREEEEVDPKQAASICGQGSDRQTLGRLARIVLGLAVPELNPTSTTLTPLHCSTVVCMIMCPSSAHVRFVVAGVWVDPGAVIAHPFIRSCRSWSRTLTIWSNQSDWDIPFLGRRGLGCARSRRSGAQRRRYASRWAAEPARSDRRGDWHREDEDVATARRAAVSARRGSLPHRRQGDLSGVGSPGLPDEGTALRAAEVGQRWQPAAAPVEFYALGGEGVGIPVRSAVASFGPTLLSRVLGLKEAQESALSLLFHFAAEHGMPLLDLNDLRSVIQFVTSGQVRLS